MATYLVSYDLNGKDEDYPRLWEAFRQLGGVKILYSEYLVKGDYTAVQVRDHFKQFLDANDMLFVTDVKSWAYTRIMNPDAAKQLLPP